MAASGLLDKTNALQRLDGAHLDLGCGPRSGPSERIGIDAVDFEGVDIVGDVFDVLAAIPDGVIAAVSSSHFLEHVDDVPRLLGEVARVLRSNGTMSATVPHWSNPFFYSDPTHRATYGLYTFAYLAESTLFRRAVPRYAQTSAFTLESVRLRFGTEEPNRPLRKAFGGVSRLVNRSPRSQETYERLFATIVPASEVRVVLRKNG